MQVADNPRSTSAGCREDLHEFSTSVTSDFLFARGDVTQSDECRTTQGRLARRGQPDLLWIETDLDAKALYVRQNAYAKRASKTAGNYGIPHFLLTAVSAPCSVPALLLEPTSEGAI